MSGPVANQTRSAWREPMVWLLLAIPLLTIAGGIWTIRLTAGPMDSMPERVTRTAQIQVADLSADLEAARRQLRAELIRIDAQRWRLRTEGLAGAEALVLIALHPNDARLDRRQTLTGTGEFSWDLGALPIEHWQFRLQPESERWRLLGQWRPATQTIHFTPRVAAAE